jgi:hypothetical protein
VYGGTAGPGGSPMGQRMQPRNEKFFTLFKHGRHERRRQHRHSHGVRRRGARALGGARQSHARHRARRRRHHYGSAAWAPPVLAGAGSTWTRRCSLPCPAYAISVTKAIQNWDICVRGSAVEPRPSAGNIRAVVPPGIRGDKSFTLRSGRVGFSLVNC